MLEIALLHQKQIRRRETMFLCRRRLSQHKLSRFSAGDQVNLQQKGIAPMVASRLALGLSCLILSGCTVFPTMAIERSLSAEQRALSESQKLAKEVAELAAGSQVRLIRESTTGKESVTIGTVLQADATGVALLNSETAQAASRFSVLASFRKIRGSSVTVQQLPVLWVPQQEIVNIVVTSSPPKNFVAPSVNLTMDSEEYFQLFETKQKLSKYEFTGLSFPIDPNTSISVR